ncbi:hypothetical protein B7486_72205 [cyanobacterium TDX16]|nr:hypothetical protein B7486_72205 [cyanobacterium TDX16]
MAAPPRAPGSRLAGAVVAGADGFVPVHAVIVTYTELPGDDDVVPRPLVDVVVGDADDVVVPCLVDSGSVHTLLPTWVADLAAIDLAGAEHRALGLGGSTTDAAMVTVALNVGEHRWEAEVGFCDPWPRSWGLLGQRSFFRHFEVTFRAADFQLELLANER